MATLTGIIVADFTTTLASALSVGGTTATLSSATDDDGVALPTGRYFLTLDGSNSSKEHISCTLTGTALTNIKTVSRQGVETAGVLRVHRIGASVSITDFAHILQINNLINGTTNLNASVPLEYDGTATISSNNQLATKQYADGLAIAGAPDSSTVTKGIGRVSVAPVSAATPIFVGDNDPRVPSQDENNALAGTFGTPSSTNRYVTEQMLTTVVPMSTQAIDGTLGSIFTRTLAANETFTQSGFTAGRVFMVELKQGSGTSYTATWFSGITWITGGATAPIQTTVTNGTTTYGFRCTGTNTFLGYLIASQ